MPRAAVEDRRRHFGHSQDQSHAAFSRSRTLAFTTCGANVFFADLNKFFYAQAKVFEVTTARPIWQQTVGDPTRRRRANLLADDESVSRSHLALCAGGRQGEQPGLLHLFVRPGHFLRQPHAEMDRENQLHVLQCSAPAHLVLLDRRSQMVDCLKHTDLRADPQHAATAPHRRTAASQSPAACSMSRRCRRPRKAPFPNYPIGRLNYRRKTKTNGGQTSSRAARRASSLIFVAALFALRALFLRRLAAGREFVHTVVIDAGHGGFDRGGIPGQRVAEKAMALDVAQRLEQQTAPAGYHVVMTRDSDVFVPLGRRVRIANAYRDAVFVCIHFNSATRAGANGIETYYYSNHSAQLAANIHRQVIAGTATENRGIRRRGYFVLRRTNIPSVLVECGFLDQSLGSAARAAERLSADRLADRIAAGVMGKPAPPNRPVVAGLTHVRSTFPGAV